MKKLFKKYNIELKEDEILKFELFLKIFKEKNSQINLSAIRDDKGIIEKHFIDSIMLNVFIDLVPSHPALQVSPSLVRKGLGGGFKIADLGTGGGFPGIPLAIINPKVKFTLIDSVGKKLKAIDDFIEKLELKNTKTLNGRAEDIGQNLDYRESFDLVTSRAVSYFPTLLEFALPLVKVGGIFAAYKLDDKEELKSAKKALIRLGGKILKVKNYYIAGQNRTIVLIQKIGKTHIKYPRKVGEPLKSPIK